MSWIEKELNQQNQQINDKQMLDTWSRELWLAVISTIRTEVETINEKYLPQIGERLKIESKHSSILENGSHLRISKDVFPAHYIDVDFDLHKRTITVETKRFNHQNDTHGRTTRQQYDVVQGEAKTAVLREKDKTITLEELTRFVLIPVLER